MRIAIVYEHPTWSVELISRMMARDIDVTPVDVGEATGPERSTDASYDLWVNRINAMPSAGRPASVVAAARHLLLSLESNGLPVFNGSQAHAIGASKIAQAHVFQHLDLATPTTIGITTQSQALAAAEQLGFPVLTKPNVGGSGSGIVRYDGPTTLRAAIDAGAVDLGVDGTGVVQRHVESADGIVHRVELLGESIFYATDQTLQADMFNYCAADGCATPTGIELVEPDPDIAAAAVDVMKATGADIAGVEYLIDAATGRPTFYDFNPYSNFIEAQPQLGFDPIERYIDAVIDKATVGR